MQCASIEKKQTTVELKIVHTEKTAFIHAIFLIRPITALKENPSLKKNKNQTNYHKFFQIEALLFSTQNFQKQALEVVCNKRCS